MAVGQSVYPLYCKHGCSHPSDVFVDGDRAEFQLLGEEAVRAFRTANEALVEVAPLPRAPSRRAGGEAVQRLESSSTESTAPSASSPATAISQVARLLSHLQNFGQKIGSYNQYFEVTIRSS